MLVLVVYIRCSVGDPREPIGGSPYEGAEEARRTRATDCRPRCRTGGALESEAGCCAVLNQLAAMREAIKDLMLQVLEGRLREHVAPAKNTGKPS